MKIAQISDIHLRTLKRHDQYRIVFEEMYKRLLEEKVDAIVITGDVFHSKISISNECIDMASNLFRRLSEIAETYIIAGNHDLMVMNLSRQDSIAPIINALNLSKLHYLKCSQGIEIGGNCVLNVLSIYDKSEWKNVVGSLNQDKINILIFHGSVVGSTSDSGWMVEKGDIDLEYIKDFSYGFLGDIHKSNQILDSKGKLRYPGSLISQNFSEDNEKGFLIWDIKTQEEYDCKFVPLHNPNPFITVELQSGKIPEDAIIPPGSFVRLSSNENLTYDVVNKALDVCKTKYGSKSVIYYNKINSEKSENFLDIAGRNTIGDIRDASVQGELIKEYLKDYFISEETLVEVLELNKKCNGAQEDEEPLRNVNWKLLRSEWDNLFNYKNGNKLDVASLFGVVGIFGRSFSGKTSAIENFLYTIFNSISKNSRKNYNLINQNKKYAKGKALLEVDGETYVIERRSDKYEKVLYGKKTEEAKTTVDFYKIDKITGQKESLNGSERNDTDKNIRKVFGTIEDFMLTSMSSQFGALEFINEGSTRRKEILAKFLNLEIFDKKFKVAKEIASDLKSAIKRSDTITECEEKIKLIVLALEESDVRTSSQREKCALAKERITTLTGEISQLVKKTNKAPKEILDIGKHREQLRKILAMKQNLFNSVEKIKDIIEEKEISLQKVVDFEKKIFNIEEYQEKQKSIDEKRQIIDKILNGVEAKEKEKKLFEKKVELLRDVPCGEQFKHCKFIADAYQAKEVVKDLIVNIDELKNSSDNLFQEINGMNPGEVSAYILKYFKILEKKNSLMVEIPSLMVKKSELDKEVVEIEKKEVQLEDIIKIYEENKEVYTNFEQIQRETASKTKELKIFERELVTCEEEVLKLYRNHGSIEQQLKSAREAKSSLENMRKEYEAYDLLLKCCHSDGIPFEIIKNKLPYINSEIAKVLANVVNFTVFFENEDDKLNLYIKHQNFDPRPLDMGSGAEKVLASLAIRLGLIKISNLPKSNFLVLDEPALSLDSTILESFSRLLEVLKENFQVIFLISHLDMLKEFVDSEIVIETKDKYAYINQ